MAPLLKNNYFLALISAILLSLAWPFIGGFSFLLFIGFIPLLKIIAQNKNRSKSNAANFWPLYIAFLGWNLGTTYWLFYVEEPLGVRIFSLASPVILNALIMVFPWLGYGFLDRYLNKTQAIFGLICLWLGYEYFHQNWELTWPWILVGNGFSEYTSWIQWYEYVGVQGGTLWVLVVNLVAWRALREWKHFETGFKSKLRVVLPFLLVVLFPIISSWIIKKNRVWMGPEREVLAVQPNINPYSEKFYAGAFQSQLSDFINNIQSAPKADLALLPETALQEPTRYGYRQGVMVLSGLWENQLNESISIPLLQEQIGQKLKTTLLSGMSSMSMELTPFDNPAEIRPVQGSNNHGRISYNAAVLIDSSRVEVYHKSKLVPGVEITPYAWIFSHFKDVALDLGGTTGTLGTQQERTVFNAGKDIKVAPIICYESVFGEYVAEFVSNGANFIAVLTNDGWWQFTAGHKQHFSYSKLRAIEMRRDVVRSANTGISAHINQLGEVVKSIPYNQKGVINCKVRLNEELTVYAKYGDYLGRNALFVAALLLTLGVVRRVKSKSVL